MASIYPGCFSASDTFLGSISERKSANRHSLTEAAVSFATILLVSMPSPGLLVTDIAQKDKNKAKQTKPSTGMERV
ncbi:hypothetical protein Tco_0812281 [Tanacetum coccineum]